MADRFGRHGLLYALWQAQGLTEPLVIPDSAGRATGRAIWLFCLAGLALAAVWASQLTGMPEAVIYGLLALGCGLSLVALSLLPEMIFRRRYGLGILSDAGVMLCDTRVVIPFAAIRAVKVVRIEILDLDVVSIVFDGASHYKRLLSPAGYASLAGDWLAERFLLKLHLPLQRKLLNWAASSEDENSKDAAETRALIDGFDKLEEMLAWEKRQLAEGEDRTATAIDLGNSPALSADAMAAIICAHAGLPAPISGFTA